MQFYPVNSPFTIYKLCDDTFIFINNMLLKLQMLLNKGR